MKRMICLINDEQDPGVPISREDRRLMEKGLSSEAFLLAQQSSFELNAAMMGETPFPVSYDQLDNEISPQSPVREESADMFDGLETQNLNELPGAPRGQVSDMTAHWNSNALVGRLHVPVRIPDSRGTLPMMGPRSYFEESYAQTVRQNVRADDILREKLEAQEEEIRLNPQLAEEKSAQALLASKTAASLTDLSGKDKGSVYYTPAGKEQLHALRPDDMKRTIRERKELFYRLINKKTGQFVDEESETETGGPTERV